MDARKHLKWLLPHYIQHRNYIGKGNQEITTLRQIAQVVLIAKVAYPFLPAWLLAFGAAAITVGYWCIGYTWDSMKGYDQEAEWGNKRNPTLQHIKRKA